MAAWGGDVDATTASTDYEICTVAANCKLGGPLNFGGTLNDPEGIATDASGNVYVGDVNFARIDKFSSSGTWLRAWGQDVIRPGQPGDTGAGYEVCTVLAACKNGVQGPAGGQMGGPYGIAVGASNRLYEADGVNDRIQVFDTSGNFIAAWGADVIAGNADTGFEICTVAADCKAATNGGLGTGLGGELWNPHGISIGCGDALYVANTSSMRVERFGDAAPPPSCGGGPGGGGGGPGPLPPPFILNGCLNTDATGAGKALGPAELGRSMKAQRAIFAGADLHSRKRLDRYCAAGGGTLKIGYPTRKLLKAAGRKLAKRIKRRVVLIETTSGRFGIAGLHVGDAAAAVHGTKRKIGHHTWYLLKRSGGARPLVETKAGKIAALGIGDARLTKSKKLAKAYLTAWKLG
jgi:hypothetical protein